MAKLLDDLPDRRGNPLYRVETYVDRRVGMVDPVEQERRMRALVRAPQPPINAGILSVPAGTADATATDEGFWYRERGGAGVADRVMARIKNAAGAFGMVQAAWWSDVVAHVAAAVSNRSLVGHTHSDYSLVGHTHSQYSLDGHTHAQYSLNGHTHTILNRIPVVSVSIAAGATGSATAVCSAGEKISGGGFTHSGASTTTFVTSSIPSGNGWQATAYNNGSGPLSLSAHAVCLTDTL